ncbi:Methyltransferase domain-containing protein [Rhizobiales bacterium GAS191]|nr:Methyltransferase domain-containing protein [Rhizobiales bacterium GAS113]SEE94036.1 Methyltransferase domain-containing protein [Rhizobiales bacterium GAS191]
MSQGLALQPTPENVREYWNRRPCNIRHSRQEVGSRTYFDEVEERKYFVEPHIPGFAQFDRWKGKKVLEVGCGIGTDAVNFARAGADYTAVELSDKSLELARQRFKLFGLKGNFIACNAEKLSSHVDASAFDLVYSFGVIHHTPDQRAVVEQVRRVIKDDGEFRMMLYAQNSWKQAMIDAGFDQPEAQSGCPLATAYTEDMVHGLTDGLFKVVETRQAHIFPYVVEKYVKYEYEVQPWFAAMPKAMFEALEQRFGWHLLITARPA